MYNVNIVMEYIKKLKYISGKSTVASLLERFYDPINGVVKLDGLDIRTLDLSWLRGQVIGFINQVLIIFHLKSLCCRFPCVSSHESHSLSAGAGLVRIIYHGEHPLWEA